MQMFRSSLLAREDTLLGVCEAIGEDFGFNPLYLRISFAVLLLWNPEVVIGAYLVVGLTVAISRLLFPTPRPRHAGEAREPAQATDEGYTPEPLDMAA